MRTYSEHRQLIGMVYELAELLEGQSRLLLKLARDESLPAAIGPESRLHETWPFVGSAFQLLANHARSLEAEYERLGLVLSQDAD